MTGANWTTYGSQGDGQGQFQGLLAISFDAEGRIYLTDAVLQQIVRIDNITGANWTTFGSTGSGIGLFNTPIGIDIF
jgi:hypothetical protein